MGTGSPLKRLDDLDGYRQSFTDAGLWRPFVERVCREHAWSCTKVRPGVAGTFPTFIVDEQLVIKFFGRLFEGEMCWQVEQEAAGLISGVPAIPAARLVASGVLEGEPGWNYLVFEYAAGVSIGEIYAGIPFEDKIAMARKLGEWLSQLHCLKVDPGTKLPRLGEDLARSWFASRWPAERAKWPTHLAAQVEPYLLANAAYLQAESNCFIHADLTQDHILGRLADGHFTVLAVIDFGDAMLGNIYYELAALHLDLFDCDKCLLAEFLRAYYLSHGQDFVRRAMVTSLMHQFDVYAPLFAWKPEFNGAGSLEELAERIWEVND